MEYKKFSEELREAVQQRLGSSARAVVLCVPKVNRGPVFGISVFRGQEQAASAICLDHFYEEYRGGGSLAEVSEEVLAAYRQSARTEAFDPAFYADYEKVRAGITCRLMNYEKNRYLLKGVPHRRFFDLAVVYDCQVSVGASGRGSILIQNEHLAQWETDPETLHETAMENTRRRFPYELLPVETLLRELDEAETVHEEKQEAQPFAPDKMPETENAEAVQAKNANGGNPDGAQLYVLTNAQRCCGAASILFEDVLEKTAQKLGGDYFVLPSSIHECMILPDDGLFEAEQLHRMVHEINTLHVMPEEVLGASVYRYSAAEHRLTVAWDAEADV